MVDEAELERVYQEGLEESIISYLAAIKDITLEAAMDIYYRSKLADKIHEGVYGIQYLDYKNLVQVLIENEPELFDSH